MPRPSRNLDRALLDAGRELFPHRGCAGLSVREVAEAAGVNLGMFHYHFKTREAFLRALLEGVYEEMYARLEVAAARPVASDDPVEHLREALRSLGRFARTHRTLLARLLADALSADEIAIGFVRANFPRHIGVIHGLMARVQEAGRMKPLPIPQAMALCAGSIVAPIIFGGAALDSGAFPAAQARALQGVLLDEAAIDQRIDTVLEAITLPAPAPRRATRKRGAR